MTEGFADIPGTISEFEILNFSLWLINHNNDGKTVE